MNRLQTDYDKIQFLRKIGWEIGINLSEYLETGCLLPEETTAQKLVAARKELKKSAPWFIRILRYVGLRVTYSRKR
jgi:hypothetical protein